MKALGSPAARDYSAYRLSALVDLLGLQDPP